MGVYLITFSISYILCLWGEKWIKNNKRIRAAKFILFLSVLTVAVIAGLRDNSVGTDTLAYTTYYVEYGSRFHSLKDFMSFFAVYEPGFNLFSYVVGVLFNHNSQWFLFWCALIIYGFTMKAFYYYRNNCSISLAWLFFLMVNCTEALNITRHYIALAIAAYAFCYVFEKDFKKFTIFTIIAISFHVSAGFNFLLYFIYKGLHQFNTKWYKMLVVIGTVIVSFMYSYIFQLLSVFNFIGSKTEGYLNMSGFAFQVNPLLIRLPFFLLILLHYNSFREAHFVKSNGEVESRDVFGDFCFLVIVIEIILSQLRGFSVTLYRLTTYLAVLKYVSYSRVTKLPSYRANRAFLYLLAILYVVIVFIYWGVVLESGNIVPYTSEMLGI